MVWFIIVGAFIFLCLAMWYVDKMEEWSRKTHYLKEDDEKSLCGKKGIKYTQEENGVSCKRCLYILRRRKYGT